MLAGADWARAGGGGGRWDTRIRDNQGMDEQANLAWKERDEAAYQFWSKFIYGTREAYAQGSVPGETIQTAMYERFSGIDRAVAKALETGCVYLRYRRPEKHPEVTILTFSDSKGRRFQHSVKMDARFAPEGRELGFHDQWWFEVLIGNMILNEGKVKPDPRGGFIPDAIIENAHKLRSELVAHKKTGELHLKLSIGQSSAK
jgi:hypothetical protein